MTKFVPPQCEHVPPYEHPALCFKPECLHGGPAPSDAIEDFLRAAYACKNQAGEAVRTLFITRQYKGGMAGAAADTALIAETELRAIAAFWADGDHQRLLATPGALPCLYACAADSLHLADTTDARFLARLGAFVEHPLNEEALRGAGRATATDWACANYLKAKLPCGCLDRLASLEHCAGCLKYLDPTKQAIQARVCGSCSKVAYCGVPCESADWARHRLECPGRPSLAEVARLDAEFVATRDAAISARASYEETYGAGSEFREDLNL